MRKENPKNIHKNIMLREPGILFGMLYFEGNS
jgi:hypothetical protein